MLTVSHVTKIFPGGKGYSIFLSPWKKGKCSAFSVRTGLGKSTTIRHIMGFMKWHREPCGYGILIRGKIKGNFKSWSDICPEKLPLWRV